MFDEAFTKLEMDEVAAIVDEINKDIEGSIFDPLETTILAIEPSFYPGYRFLNVADHGSNPPLERFVFQKKGMQDYTVLDWTYKTVYKLNEQAPIKLTEKNVLDYVRFFFMYVKGRHGRFIVCESSDNVQWKDEPPLEVRKKLNNTIQPLKIEETRDDGVFTIKAFMMLKDALFTVDIFVQPTGKVIMSDHEIVIEDIPVMDTAFA